MIRTILKFLGFTLVCLGFTGWLAVTIGNIRLFEDNYTLTATFDDVTGLLPNDNVKIAGVVVGKVSGVTVEKGRAKVTFTVRDDIRIPDDSAAGIRWRNLLGQRYVYLYPGESSTTYTDGDHIDKTQSVVDLGELFNRLGPIVAAIDPHQVNQFLDAIVEGLDGNQQSVQQVLGDLATLMKGLATRDEAIGDLVEDLDTVAGTLTQRDEQIRTVLDNLTELAGTFSANTDIVDTAVTELGEVSQHLGTLLSSRRAQLDGTLGSLLSVLNIVEGKLDVLDHAIGALDEASVKIFAAGRFGEFLNQVILCAGTEPYDGESVPPCPGALSGLEGVAPQGASAEGEGGAGTPTVGPTTVPEPTTGAEAVEDLVGSLLGVGEVQFPRFKSFRDVNPYLVGLSSVLVIGAFVGLAFMVGILHLFENTYTIKAVFPDAAGLKSGDEIRVAGVKAGRVTGIDADRVNGKVIVTMVVNDSVELGEEPTAEIALATLLGSKYVDIGGEVQGTPFSELPADKRVIPIERTKSPFDIFELTRLGTIAIEETDNEKLNQFINDLADITEGQRENVTELVNGLDTVASAINEREVQLRSLLDRADQLTATLAEKDETLVALIDQSRAILQLISDRREDVAAGIANGNVAMGEVARLLDVNKATIQSILDSLGPTLEVVDRRQADLNRTLAVAGPAFLGQAKAGSHGPWADIYVRALGPDVIQVLRDAFAQLPGPGQTEQAPAVVP